MAQDESDLGALADIAAGGMMAATLEGAAVLLIRDGDSVHAIGGTCTHAGGKLAEGVRHGGRVVCPWHKAAFCERSGAVLDPPALDALPMYEARVADGRILVRAAERPGAERVADGRCFVIAGAGAAGAVAAQTLRAEGFGGRIVMVDRANRVPYDRTILSKYALSGQKGAEKSPLQSQAFYREQGIERRTGDVRAVDVAGRLVTLGDGSVLGYDALLLATGAVPRAAGLPGEGLRGVFTLRSRADADAIVAQAERSERAVVLGASFIGMEVAASLRERGLEVTVVGHEAAPFAKQLGPEVGRAFVGLHEKRGVRFRLGVEIQGMEGEGAVAGVRLKGGEVVPAELVVVGFGVKPETGYAEGLRRGEDGGIEVDAGLLAAPGVYAAGDIARFPQGGDGGRIRVEHWRVAEQHGRVAALNMLGRGVKYDAVPFFWTIQYMKRLDYVGHAAAWDELVVHGDLGEPDFLAYYVKDGVVRAAAGLGRDQQTAALIELFGMREWTAAELGETPAAVLAGMA